MLRVVLADFGISVIVGATTKTGGMSGTPETMCPEQYDRSSFGPVTTKVSLLPWTMRVLFGKA